MGPARHFSECSSWQLSGPSRDPFTKGVQDRYCIGLCHALQCVYIALGILMALPLPKHTTALPTKGCMCLFSSNLICWYQQSKQHQQWCRTDSESAHSSTLCRTLPLLCADEATNVLCHMSWLDNQFCVMLPTASPITLVQILSSFAPSLCQSPQPPVCSHLICPKAEPQHAHQCTHLRCYPYHAQLHLGKKDSNCCGQQAGYAF